MTDIGTQTEALEDIGELEEDAPRVGIIMGSKSDLATMEKAGEPLDAAGIRYEVRVMSAHREPEVVADYCANAHMRGLRVIIAGAGLSADLPVIGVPLTSAMTAAGGLDAILSVVQMPPGVPVAAVGLDNPKNAGHLAARILRAAT
jgi:phosphoribosylaminoimidazole carboxylase PurE protein